LVFSYTREQYIKQVYILSDLKHQYSKLRYIVVITYKLQFIIIMNFRFIDCIDSKGQYNYDLSFIQRTSYYFYILKRIFRRKCIFVISYRWIIVCIYLCQIKFCRVFISFISYRKRSVFNTSHVILLSTHLTYIKRKKTKCIKQLLIC